MYQNNLSRSTKRILALPSGKSDIQFFYCKKQDLQILAQKLYQTQCNIAVRTDILYILTSFRSRK